MERLISISLLIGSLVLAAFLPTTAFVSRPFVVRPSVSALNESANNEDKDQRLHHESFLEEASRNGADKIQSLSIEERTKRAMLAEAVEDRMHQLSENLDELLGDDGMPLKVEYREEVELLARQIKASRDQYQLLVSGEPSSMLDTLNGRGDSGAKG